MTTGRAWLTCTLWLGDESRVCGDQAAHRYMQGPRCPRHTPAAVAGRPESLPDPKRTLPGLLAGPSIAERRARPRPKRFKPASRVRGKDRFYTSADHSELAHHRAARQVGDVLEQQRRARIDGAT